MTSRKSESDMTSEEWREIARIIERRATSFTDQQLLDMRAKAEGQALAEAGMMYEVGSASYREYAFIAAAEKFRVMTTPPPETFEQKMERIANHMADWAEKREDGKLSLNPLEHEQAR